MGIPERKFNFLVGDDFPLVRYALEELLLTRFRDACVRHARNFDEVINEACEMDFDLVILDISMEGGNRVAMLHDVWRVQPQASILLLSDHDEVEYSLKYVVAGASGYLHKGCGLGIILTAVGRILGFTNEECKAIGCTPLTIKNSEDSK